MDRLALASLHLLALGLGLGAVLARAGALREVPGPPALRRALRADALWGLAAALWLVTGLWRWLGSVEKPSAYYLRNGLFHAKLALFVLVCALEAWPMITLLRWRRAQRAGKPVEEILAGNAPRRIATLSTIEAVVVVAMIFVAVAIARGYGARV